MGSVTPQDELQREAEQAAAEAIGKALEWIGIKRQVASISRSELNTLAVAAVTGWVLKRAEQAQREPDAGIATELMG